MTLLANAASPESSSSDVELVLIGAAVFAVIAAIGLVPILISRSKSRRSNETIVAVMLLWGMLTGGSVIYAIMQQMNWSAEYQTRLESGYYDPAAASDDAPKSPVVFWGGMGVAYVGILFWSARTTTNVDRAL